MGSLGFLCCFSLGKCLGGPGLVVPPPIHPRFPPPGWAAQCSSALGGFWPWAGWAPPIAGDLAWWWGSRWIIDFVVSSQRNTPPCGQAQNHVPFVFASQVMLPSSSVKLKCIISVIALFLLAELGQKNEAVGNLIAIGSFVCSCVASQCGSVWA